MYDVLNATEQVIPFENTVKNNHLALAKLSLVQELPPIVSIIHNQKLHDHDLVV